MKGFQFSTRHALIALAFASIWCANAAWEVNHRMAPTPTPLRILSVFAAISMPAAVFGSLAGRPWFALACGAVGAGVYVAWELGVMIWLPRH